MFFLGKKIPAKGHDLKLSPLEFMILLETYQSEPVGISGYDLISNLNSTAVGQWTATSGTVYPILSRMKDKGLLSIVEMRSEIGPAKKVYHVTGRAKEVIETLVYENLEPELIFFGNYLTFVLDAVQRMVKRGILTEMHVDKVKSALVLLKKHLETLEHDLEAFMKEYLAKKRDDEGAAAAKCKNCGMDIEISDARFCPGCGNKL